MWDWNAVEMRLHLIRHGKTLANTQKLYCGVTDLSVSEDGMRELRVLKKKVAYPTASLHVVSGLRRTIQTANLLFDHPVLHPVTQLQEINFGAFEMQGYETLRWMQSYQNWIANIEQVTPLGGENKQMFVQRVRHGLQAIEALCERHETNQVLVVTHGGVIATIMEEHFPQQKNFYEWQPECGRGYTVCLGEEKCYERI